MPRGQEIFPPRIGAAAAAEDTDTRAATIVVAADDSLDPTLAGSDYRCNGTVDEVEINAAIGVLL